jgi:AcrR family transcriptional regulator
MPKGTPTTRERILETCLRLFNESGPDAVTTAEIARAVGINEGNLYYYFKKKEDILVALFELFEAALDRVAGAGLPTVEPGKDPGAAYLKTWFELMWEWRFFYRHGVTVSRVAPRLLVRQVALADRGQAAVRLVLSGMTEAGLLRATPEQIDRLVVNAWIVSAYWLDYLYSRHTIEHVSREHLDWGFQQVLNLFVPYRPGAG